MPAPFDPVTRLAVVAVCRLADVEMIMDEAGPGTVSVCLSSDALVALVEAGSGIDGTTGADGRWADLAAGELVDGLCAGSGTAWADEATVHVASLLAAAADNFDAVAFASLSGPVLFSDGDATAVVAGGFPDVSWVEWATIR